MGVALGWVLPAQAHCVLEAPNGGEVLTAGSVATVQWRITIAHDLLNWDLWFSTDSGANYTPIATDLPPGSPAAGRVHTYDWTVPDVPSDQVRVRVQMDNSGNDYLDESDADFTIETAGAPIPTVSEWGVIAMALLALTAGTVVFTRRTFAPESVTT